MRFKTPFISLLLVLSFANAETIPPGISYPEYLNFHTPIDVLLIDDLGYFSRYQLNGIPDDVLKSRWRDTFFPASPEGYISLIDFPPRIFSFMDIDNPFKDKDSHVTPEPESGFDYYQGDYDYRFVSIFYAFQPVRGSVFRFYGDDLIYQGRYGLFNAAKQGNILQQNYHFSIRHNFRQWRMKILGMHRAKTPAVIHFTSRSGIRKSRVTRVLLVMTKSAPNDSSSFQMGIGGGTFRYEENHNNTELSAESSSLLLSYSRYRNLNAPFRREYHIRFNNDFLFPEFQRLVQPLFQLNLKQFINLRNKVFLEIGEFLYLFGKQTQYSIDSKLTAEISSRQRISVLKNTFVNYVPFQYRLQYGLIKIPLLAEKINRINQTAILWEFRFGESFLWETGFYNNYYSPYYSPVYSDSLDGVEILRLKEKVPLFKTQMEMRLIPGISVVLEGCSLLRNPSRLPVFWFRNNLNLSVEYKTKLFERLDVSILWESAAYQPMNKIAYSSANDFLYSIESRYQYFRQDMYIIFWNNIHITAKVKSFTIFYHAGSIPIQDFLAVPESLYRGRLIYFGVRWNFLD